MSFELGAVLLAELLASVSPHPVVARAHLDALAAKVERVRDGLALARERGLDSRRLLKKLGAVGPALSREDFLAAEALIGPASGILLARFLQWVEALNVLFQALLQARVNPSALRTGGVGIARGAWAMAHSAMLQIDTAPREWVTEWASQDTWSRHSAWTAFVRLSALPFQLRAAWIAARLGKPIPSYKARFARPYDAMELREAGWGLVAMGLRHQGLRSEIWRTLLGRSVDVSEEEWVEPLVKVFAHAARLLDEKEEQLLAVKEAAEKKDYAACIAAAQDVVKDYAALGREQPYTYLSLRAIKAGGQCAGDAGRCADAQALFKTWGELANPGAPRQQKEYLDKAYGAIAGCTGK